MGNGEVDGQMIEQVSAETWFSSMAWTSVGAHTELSKNGNTFQKFIFLKGSAIRARRHDGGKKTGMEREWSKQRRERARWG